MFTQQDIVQIIAHGQTVEGVEQQLARFVEGFPFLAIRRAAVVGDGIIRLDSDAVQHYGQLYRQLRTVRKMVKFVPASGAATRMFKALFEFLHEGKQDDSVTELLSKLDHFAFAEALFSYLKEDREPRRVVANIITEGLAYGVSPKALILFHRYADRSRTAFEEHLVEGAMYAAGINQEVHIHFTVSAEHLDAFKRLAAEVVPENEVRYGVTYHVSYSGQKASTDTLAVHPDNSPFRDAEGGLLFRPAGHGALIENLNDVDADLVFIKTVDNVAPDGLKRDTVAYKEALAGMLLSMQQQCFEYLKRFGQGDRACVAEAAAFVSEKLGRKLSEDFFDQPEDRQMKLLEELLNRPIRVCGMVRNEGEPGGGPFWVAEADGGESLQIAESSQIAPEQNVLMTQATHFNPVDVVCGVRDYRGVKFDLTRYVDPRTGFISSKSQQGRSLRAMELPGLWNGAMAQWNTVFVEVPITTFSPVKTVNDLLRAQHQAEGMGV